MSLQLEHFYFKCRNRKTEFKIDIFLHDDQEDMLNYIKRPNHTEVLACFIPSNGTNRYLGAIHFNKETLEIEDIIHESEHAGIKLQKNLGRHISEKNEEQIVDSSASLASEIIKMLIDKEVEIHV